MLFLKNLGFFLKHLKYDNQFIVKGFVVSEPVLHLNIYELLEIVKSIKNPFSRENFMAKAKEIRRKATFDDEAFM